MKLFGKIKKQISENVQTKFKLVTETGNGFFCWNGKVYESDIVRACIRPKARAVGKLAAKHIRGSEVNPEPYMRILLEEPNPFMSGQQLQEKMCRQLEINGNAFSLITRDENGYPTGIFPIIPMNAEAVYNASGKLFIKFYLQNGRIYTFPYSDLIHLRQDYNENDVFGAPLISSLAPLMEVVTTTDQGMVNAIKNSAVIRWLLKFTQSMRPEDLQRQAKEFSQNYLENSQENFGVAAVDAKADAVQVTSHDYVPNSAQMKETKSRIYSLFGTNEKIVTSGYDEDDWNAYYESAIEPVAIDMANEYTRKLFTRKERAFGNRIIFEAENLQYASLSTKLGLWQMVDRGALTPNEWRKVLNFAPVPGGDEPIRRLDTGTVKEVNEKNED